MDSHLLRVIPSLLWVRVSFLANSTRFKTLSPCRSIIAASVDQRSNAGCDRAAPRITTGLPNPVAKPPARNSSALSSDLTSSMGPAQFGRSNIATVDCGRRNCRCGHRGDADHADEEEAPKQS